MERNALKELYKEELKNLYGAETQLVEALAEMAKAAQSENLRAAFQEHLEQTREHVSRLEEIFEDLDISPKGGKCEGIEDLIEESHRTSAQKSDSGAMDASLIAAAQRVEHFCQATCRLSSINE